MFHHWLRKGYSLINVHSNQTQGTFTKPLKPLRAKRVGRSAIAGSAILIAWVLQMFFSMNLILCESIEKESARATTAPDRFHFTIDLKCGGAPTCWNRLWFVEIPLAVVRHALLTRLGKCVGVVRASTPFELPSCHKINYVNTNFGQYA